MRSDVKRFATVTLAMIVRLCLGGSPLKDDGSEMTIGGEDAEVVLKSTTSPSSQPATADTQDENWLFQVNVADEHILVSKRDESLEVILISSITVNLDHELAPKPSFEKDGDLGAALGKAMAESSSWMLAGSVLSDLPDLMIIGAERATPKARVKLVNWASRLRKGDMVKADVRFKDHSDAVAVIKLHDSGRKKLERVEVEKAQEDE